MLTRVFGSLALWTAVLTGAVGMGLSTGCQSGGGGGGGGGSGSGGASADPCADLVCGEGLECDSLTGSCQPTDSEAGGGGGDAGDRANGGGEVLQEAAERAKELDPGAIVIRASGENGEQPGGGGTHTLRWEFTAVNPEASQTTYLIRFDRQDWTVEQIDSSLLGVSLYDMLQVKMTESEARAKLAEAGLPDDFLTWILYLPIPVFAPDANPLYAFNYSEGHASVDTETGEVTSDGVE